MQRIFSFPFLELITAGAQQQYDARRDKRTKLLPLINFPFKQNKNQPFQFQLRNIAYKNKTKTKQNNKNKTATSAHNIKVKRVTN